MAHLILPKQPPWIISYLKVGKLLYLSGLLFIAESFYFLNLFLNAYTQKNLIFTGIWFTGFIFSFVHIFLVVMDGWSRFQNYKRIKDQLYIHGFDTRLVVKYKESKCQRNAALVAARELGIENEVRKFYRKLGIRWYHFIPHFMLQDPFFLIRKSFWSRTFLEKFYKPKVEFRQIFLSQIRTNRDLTSSF